MNAGGRRVYLVLLLLHTLASSFIWGINTLFLLDAGLSNAQAFAANAFFTAGLVLFEVPTGVVADMRGRRLSYLLGTLTLAVPAENSVRVGIVLCLRLSYAEPKCRVL
jgi:MFS family permease